MKVQGKTTSYFEYVGGEPVFGMAFSFGSMAKESDREKLMAKTVTNKVERNGEFVEVNSFQCVGD